MFGCPPTINNTPSRTGERWRSFTDKNRYTEPGQPLHSAGFLLPNMANRILRDWTDSDKMNLLSSDAERFFVRLIMKADDFGCFHASENLLIAYLFPLKIDTENSIKKEDIVQWLSECEKVGLIKIYTANERKYLQIISFGQRLRTMSSKFPQPADNQPTIDSVPPPSADNKPPETKGSEVETKQETETRKEGEDENNTKPSKVPGQTTEKPETKEIKTNFVPPKPVYTAKRADQHIEQVKQEGEAYANLFRQLRSRYQEATKNQFYAILDGFAGKFDGVHPNGETLIVFTREWGWYVNDLRKLPDVTIQPYRKKDNFLDR